MFLLVPAHPGCPRQNPHSRKTALWILSGIITQFIITQPESWYSFHRPTEGRRLSRPRHCRKGAAARAQDCESDSCRDKRTDSGFSPTARYVSTRPLQPARPVGVSNLPKVTAGSQRDSNSAWPSCNIARSPRKPYIRYL